MKNIVIALLLMPSMAFGRVVKFERSISIDSLEAKLRAEGFLVESTTCAGRSCVLRLKDSEKKDPSSIIAAEPAAPTYEERQAAADRLQAELAAIETKSDADLTLTDLKRAFRIMIRLGGFSRRVHGQ